VGLHARDHGSDPVGAAVRRNQRRDLHSHGKRGYQSDPLPGESAALPASRRPA
jgi:hypothetical protein